MQIKIYVGDKILYLCNEMNSFLQQLKNASDTIFIDKLNTHSIKTILKELENPEINKGIFLHEDFDTLKKLFFKRFEIIQAGGGLIINDKDEVLLIFRRGFWDLPKGKLDKGETLEQCAVREVKEETNIDAILQKPLTITYHTYEEGSRRILKESHWYLMHADNKQKTEPQLEEGIQLTKWVNKKYLSEYKNKAYASVVDVLNLLYNM